MWTALLLLAALAGIAGIGVGLGAGAAALLKRAGKPSWTQAAAYAVAALLMVPGLLVVLHISAAVTTTAQATFAAAVQSRYGLTVLDPADLPGDGIYTLRRPDGSTVRCQITGPDAAPRVDCLTPQHPTGH